MNNTTGVGWGAAIRAAGFKRSFAILTALVGGLLLTGFVIPRMATQLTGVEGSFTARSCKLYDPDSGKRSVLCSGSFTAADNSFTIADLAVDTTFDKAPTEPVKALVDGPDATGAVSRDLKKSVVPGVTGLIVLGFGLWNLRTLARTARRGPEVRPGSATAPTPAV
ncbi:hypothetical protein ABT144_17985 [Streptomyces sp. NPDC002039]|uniref:hypothetical protein n=1 Tax=unclassified Streptomyces TaxID=2593676 RepID=UPI00332E94A8